MNEYVDVRAPWPIYVNGQSARSLPGAPRTISLAEARRWVPPVVEVDA